MTYETFVRDFYTVCNEHIQNGRAQGFAFLFYEQQSPVAEAIDDADGFSILNLASGEDLTIFYLTNPSASGDLFPKFNRTFLRELNVKGQIRPPCIVFFRVDGTDIEDVAFFRIDPRLPHHMIIEQVRRHVSTAVRGWSSEGDFSALSGIPLLKVLGELKKLIPGS